MLSGMKIFAVRDTGGCGYYRLTVPLTELAKHGHDVTLVERFREGEFNPGDYDILIGQRLSNYDGLAKWRQFRTSRNRLVYENDDDIFSLTPDNPAFRDYADLSVRAGSAAYITYADLVTVTNETLADEMETHAAPSRYPVVLPNYVREFVLDLPREESTRLRLGYMGAAAHGYDVEQVTESVRRFIRQNRDWDLKLVGSDYRASFRAPANRMFLTPWVNIVTDEKGFYQSLDCDIAIAPLRDTKFNRSKSYIKALEYNARGIPVIASNVGPYSDYIAHGVNGFLVNKPHEWSKYLNLLANDHDLRVEMSRDCRDVARDYTIEGNWWRWEKAYEGLFK